MISMIDKYVGKRFQCNDGEYFTIIEYIDAYNITIMFDDGFIKEKVQSSHIKNGNVKTTNPAKASNSIIPTFFNVGYMGIGYNISKNNNKYYYLWISMLTRCYDEKYKTKYPTYKDCYVSDEFLNFQNFVEWCKINYIEGFVLDKDILYKNNKVYSSNTCCFIPEEINKLFEKCNARRGNTYIGVTNTKEGKFRASGTQENTTSKHIGIFSSNYEAFQAYKIIKEKQIKNTANKYKQIISKDVYEALYNYKVEITD